MCHIHSCVFPTFVAIINYFYYFKFFFEMSSVRDRTRTPNLWFTPQIPVAQNVDERCFQSWGWNPGPPCGRQDLRLLNYPHAFPGFALTASPHQTEPWYSEGRCRHCSQSRSSSVLELIDENRVKFSEWLILAFIYILQTQFSANWILNYLMNGLIK